MLSVQLALLSLLLPFSHAESLLGVYIFERHGDRTAKGTPPANLTGLGYQEAFTTGSYYRSRYINSTGKIAGISTDIVKQSQISASAPLDTVLTNSAQAFLQGLYPPAGSNPSYATEKLRDNTVVQIPMNNYQLIPVTTVTTGTAGAEDAGWVQGQSGCKNAIISSNAYFTSSEYTKTMSDTNAFYKTLVPLVNNTYAEDFVTYKNAYLGLLSKPHVVSCDANPCV